MIVRLSESSVVYVCAQGMHEGSYRPERIGEVRGINLIRLG